MCVGDESPALVTEVQNLTAYPAVETICDLVGRYPYFFDPRQVPLSGECCPEQVTVKFGEVFIFAEGFSEAIGATKVNMDPMCSVQNSVIDVARKWRVRVEVLSRYMNSPVGIVGCKCFLY